MNDRDLVNAEIARLAAVQPGDDYGFERAYARSICLHRLGFAHAAAVLRQEMLCQLAPNGVPWYDPEWVPVPAWYTERNRMHFLADQAGLTDYRLPEDSEIRTAIRWRRQWRIAGEGPAPVMDDDGVVYLRAG